MRILALDYGTKRVGVAISDELQTIAQPLEFISAGPFNRFMDRLKELIREREVGKLVVGMPRNMDGSYGPAAQQVEEFMGKLREGLEVPIESWDERLTSQEANRALLQGNVRRDKRKTKTDQMAAALLLQSYLDRLGPPEL